VEVRRLEIRTPNSDEAQGQGCRCHGTSSKIGMRGSFFEVAVLWLLKHYTAE